ncbi:hypothetical protein BXT84_09040 [Sulfobacillus thermotolerans]|uniref:Calcineurin-like phosphoesterase domain-containing protein n=1 Tax=Sulfobacillus thermotolerans TaxID=338644 RepID=A0ABM6RS30_9FIRM|nr:hypothetical protein BXT84_09040 [Sulfobacillus thermotolerans]
MEDITLLHISDLHVDGLDSDRKLPASYWSTMAVTLNRLNPDLIVVTGDLTTHGGCDIQALYQAREFLASTGRPYLVVPGNHDLSPSSVMRKDECYEDVKWPKTHFSQVFSQPSTVTQHIGPVSVIGIALRDGDPDQSLLQLKTALSQAPGPVLVFGHYPLRPVRTQGVLAEFGWSQYIPNTMPEFRRILKSSPRVRLYGCGHVHAASVQPITPALVQISAGGLGPGPSQYWLYKINAQDVTFYSVAGPGPATFWNEVDAEHGNVYDYNWGKTKSGLIRLAHEPSLLTLSAHF